MYESPGTAPYLAPEQRRGQTHGPSVDYWAFGLVGYELLTGDATQQRVEVGSMLEEYHRKLDEIGSVIAKCCKNMLSADPTLRMTAKDAMEALGLVSILAEATNQVTPESARKRMRTK